MIYFRKPSHCRLNQDIARLSHDAKLSYSEVGATRSDVEFKTVPLHYNRDRYTTVLGHGREVFDRAKEGLQLWQNFRVPNVTAIPSGSLKQDTVVAIVVRIGPLHWLNLCRILYVIETGERFGFAYGTLEGHAEQGEERFSVSIDTESNLVTYEILAFSRPKHILARMGKPLARRMQRRFSYDSLDALKKFVSTQA